MSVASNAQVLVSKHKLTSCKRCGEADLAWVFMNNGKWILCPTTSRKLWVAEDGDGSLPKGFVIAIKMRPHQCGETERKQLAQQQRVAR